MSRRGLNEPGLATLLDLDGEIFPHEGNKVRRYKFESAGQLLEDFWNDVKRIIGDV